MAASIDAACSASLLVRQLACVAQLRAIGSRAGCCRGSDGGVWVRLQRAATGRQARDASGVSSDPLGPPAHTAAEATACDAAAFAMSTFPVAM
jgi:hypothetical protein